MSSILAIDSASDMFAVAVEREGAVRSLEADGGADHSRQILPSIADILGDDQLEAILVTVGPGTYAGVRVGMATAEGLALARGVSLHGIGTLEAVALASGLGEVTAVHPAGRGEYAAQAFRHGEALEPPRIVSATELSGPIAGEGAGALGGVEISPGKRCEAGLRARSAAIRGGAEAGGIEAFYLREPSITISRRRPAGP